jgi:hypothetical protein
VYGASAMLVCCTNVLATDYLRRQDACDNRRLELVILSVLSMFLNQRLVAVSMLI